MSAVATKINDRADDVVDLLSKSIGDDAAALIVDQAIRALGLVRPIDHPSALRVLERISHEAGLVGVAARFAKSRLLLRR
jgi:hypothetical protein